VFGLHHNRCVHKIVSIKPIHVDNWLRQADSPTLLVSRTRTNLGDRAFSAAGPRVWIELSADGPQTAGLSCSRFRESPKTFLWSLSPSYTNVINVAYVVDQLLGHGTCRKLTTCNACRCNDDNSSHYCDATVRKLLHRRGLSSNALWWTAALSGFLPYWQIIVVVVALMMCMQRPQRCDVCRQSVPDMNSWNRKRCSRSKAQCEPPPL